MTDKGKEAKAENTHATSSTSDQEDHQDWMRKKKKKWEDWMPIPGDINTSIRRECSLTWDGMTGFGEKKSWLLKRTP